MEQFILEAAIEGLEARKARIEAQIGQVTGLIEGFIKPALMAFRFDKTRKLWEKDPPTPKAAAPKRTMSAAGKAAIKAGQAKRWAAFHKAQKRGKK